MKEPLVSIITPCYNSEKHIHRLLDSILNQTYNNIEFITVDDGSTDNTKKVVESYQAKFKDRGFSLLYIFQKNKGQAAALNKGLKLFKGQFLTWPDSDDYLENDSIKERALFLIDNPEYGIVRANGYLVDEANLQKTRRVFTTLYQADIFEDLLLQRISITPVSYMIRSELFLESYPRRCIYESRSGQNYQMFLPISSKSKCGFIDKDLCNILVRQNSHSRQSRSLENYLSRTDDVENIILNTLTFCDPRYKEYIDKLKEHYTRKRFNYARKCNDIALLKKQYILLQKRKAVTFADTLSYYKARHKWIDHILRLLLIPSVVIKKRNKKSSG